VFQVGKRRLNSDLQNGDSNAIMSLIMAFIPRFLTLGRDHSFLLGPRGTGKTLWCANQFPNALRVDLLDPATLRQLMAQPERLRELVDANIQKKHIVIDEIQKLPGLLEVVHQLIERKSGQQFILTGSSARKLRRQGVNLLGGRAVEKRMHPYMAAELGPQFKLEKALKQGMLPVVWAAEDSTAILQAYNGLYLREEVQFEGLVRNIGSFARFMEAMSFAHASVLNLAAVSRDCQVSSRICSSDFESRYSQGAPSGSWRRIPSSFFLMRASSAKAARLARLILPQNLTAPRLRASSASTCALGATTPKDDTACTTGKHVQEQKWISSCTENQVSMPLRLRTPAK
jgi:hypothetical protein